MFLCFHVNFKHKAQKHACFHVNFPFSAYFYPPPITSYVKGLLHQHDHIRMMTVTVRNLSLLFKDSNQLLFPLLHCSPYKATE